jgi:hypothetical protein
MHTVPKSVQIVAENMQSGIGCRRPRRDTDYDNGASHERQKRVAPEIDLRTTHDRTRYPHM